MIVSPFSSPVLSPLFADDAAALLFGDVAMIRAMLEAEAALAEACAECGLIPAAAAAKIGKAAAVLPDLKGLGAAVRRHGSPVTALAAHFKKHAQTPYAHFGATSQDIVDTAFVLQLRRYLPLVEKKLAVIIRQLAGLAKKHEASVMSGRTRWQQAAPITFGLKVAQWMLPLLAQQERLQQLRPRLLVAQLGGAVGTRAAWRGKGDAVNRRFAKKLALAATVPWHTRRDGLAELANWSAMTAAMLAKIGGDIKLLAQSEIAEIVIDGGASSAMPHKRNPVAAETLQSVSGHIAALLPQIIAAMTHHHERDGEAWQKEWLAMPAILVAAAGAAEIAVDMTRDLKPDVKRMRANIEADNGRMLADAFLRELSIRMAPAKAEILVQAALQKTASCHLADSLAEQCAINLNWQELKNPDNHIGDSIRMTRHILQQRKQRKRR